MASSLDSFRNPSTGSFDWAGSTNAGTAEGQKGGPASPQQSTESAASYAARMNAFNNAKKDSK